MVNNLGFRCPKNFIFHIMVLGAHGFYCATKLTVFNRSFILKVTSNLGFISRLTSRRKIKKVYIDLFAPENGGGLRGSQYNKQDFENPWIFRSELLGSREENKKKRRCFPKLYIFPTPPKKWCKQPGPPTVLKPPPLFEKTLPARLASCQVPSLARKTPPIRWTLCKDLWAKQAHDSGCIILQKRSHRFFLAMGKFWMHILVDSKGSETITISGP